MTPQEVRVITRLAICGAFSGRYINAHNRPGDHPGGGDVGGGESSGGKSPAGSSSGKKHSVKLPAKREKLNIVQSQNAMEQMGYKVGNGKASVVGGKFVITYSVTLPDGTTKDMGTDELKDIVYSGASK